MSAHNHTHGHTRDAPVHTPHTFALRLSTHVTIIAMTCLTLTLHECACAPAALGTEHGEWAREHVTLDTRHRKRESPVVRCAARTSTEGNDTAA